MRITIFQLIFFTLFHIHYISGSNSLGRIVGGQSTNIINHPYQVQISIEDIYVCGGSILTTKFVLSAAHCFEKTHNASWITVRAGTSFRSKGGQIGKVKKVNLHSKYNPDILDYDIAVLELASPLVYGTAVAPVTLPPRSTAIKDGQLAVATGWGLTNNDGFLADQLQVVTLPLISTKSCQKTIYGSAITTRMFCAGKLGQDTCSGDSGGPLVYNGLQIGIVSWGDLCGHVSTPGVYTHIKLCLPFINSFINKK